MEYVVRTAPVRQGHRDQIVHPAPQDLPELTDPLSIRPVSLTDRHGPRVEEDHISSFQPAFILDATRDRDSRRFEIAGGGPGLVAALRLPHVAQDRAPLRHDDGVADVDRIQAGLVVARQKQDLGPGPTEELGETLVLRGRLAEIRAGGEAEVTPLRLDPALVHEGVLRTLEDEAAD